MTREPTISSALVLTEHKQYPGWDNAEDKGACPFQGAVSRGGRWFERRWLDDALTIGRPMVPGSGSNPRPPTSSVGDPCPRPSVSEESTPGSCLMSTCALDKRPLTRISREPLSTDKNLQNGVSMTVQLRPASADRGEDDRPQSAMTPIDCRLDAVHPSLCRSPLLAIGATVAVVQPAREAWRDRCKCRCRCWPPQPSSLRCDGLET